MTYRNVFRAWECWALLPPAQSIVLWLSERNMEERCPILGIWPTWRNHFTNHEVLAQAIYIDSEKLSAVTLYVKMEVQTGGDRKSVIVPHHILQWIFA